jgi:hypothetical protein
MHSKMFNLVHWQVYRVEKIGKFLLYLSKKSIFKFFDIKILMVAQKKIQGLRMMFDRFGMSFKMFSIVELTELGQHDFNIGL